MGLELHHVEILLRDEVTFHPQAELIASGSGEDQRGDIDAEIGNLEAIADEDIRQRGSADELLGVEIDQIDVEVVVPLGVSQAKI